MKVLGPSIYGSEPLKMKVFGWNHGIYGKFPILFPTPTPSTESPKIWVHSMGPAYHKGVPCPWGSLKIPSIIFMYILREPQHTPVSHTPFTPEMIQATPNHKPLSFWVWGMFLSGYVGKFVGKFLDGKFPILFPYTTPIFESLKDMGSAPMVSRFTRPFLRRLSWDPTSASEAVAAGSRFLGGIRIYMAT